MKHLLLVALFVLMVAGCSADEDTGSGAARFEVEQAMRERLAPTGVTLRSCTDQEFERDGVWLWECEVEYPQTAVAPRIERRLDVVVDEAGTVVDASPQRQ